MVLESTVVCVDNSEYMRNGDFLPTRLQAQQEAVSLVCHSKARSNPENNVGLLTLATTEVLTTLTSDVNRLLAKLHAVEPQGSLQLISGLRIAHLVLKHRQGKNHKMRIVCFVGSPIACDKKEMVKLAKRLKKENVNVDVINFGEDEANAEKLKSFVETLNGGKENAGSHLVTVSATPHLNEALFSSPIIQGEDGSGVVPPGGFEFGVDPNEDPELAMALRVSLDEMRQRQEAESGGTPGGVAVPATVAVAGEPSAEEQGLEKALQMSLQPKTGAEPSAANPAETQRPAEPDFEAMTEDEQIAYAVRMSLQQQEPMETDDAEKKVAEKKPTDTAAPRPSVVTPTATTPSKIPRPSKGKASSVAEPCPKKPRAEGSKDQDDKKHTDDKKDTDDKASKK
ncbi:26S proteasome non-ATPase regulatory subunit 4-like [Tropilaelaps mercedesae]|uniref:26S proteasome non-ATPase regulatory subunit 4 n=1 Tax=Tropilaelaps mercedesae TaxID=418985 RepID=A0A1V9X6Q6_9ACAR|nr:26S proteasome non-ATPase regulatory subunit 4-like [Tropilaelaps mercedesae]